MERDQLVTRAVYPEVPTRVEYSLTESGKALVPIWSQPKDWGAKHKEIMMEALV